MVSQHSHDPRLRPHASNIRIYLLHTRRTLLLRHTAQREYTKGNGNGTKHDLRTHRGVSTRKAAKVGLHSPRSSSCPRVGSSTLFHRSLQQTPRTPRSVHLQCSKGCSPTVVPHSYYPNGALSRCWPSSTQRRKGPPQWWPYQLS